MTGYSGTVIILRYRGVSPLTAGVIQLLFWLNNVGVVCYADNTYIYVSMHCACKAKACAGILI